MKFEYERKNITLEAYGKEYPIPTKTAVLVDGISDVTKRLEKCKNALEAVDVMRCGIALFIGDEEAEGLFPTENSADIDTDEMTAFWWALNSASNEATQEIIKRYSPNPIIRKAK